MGGTWGTLPPHRPGKAGLGAGAWPSFGDTLRPRLRELGSSSPGTGLGPGRGGLGEGWGSLPLQCVQAPRALGPSPLLSEMVRAAGCSAFVCVCAFLAGREGCCFVLFFLFGCKFKFLNPGSILRAF